MTGTCTCVVQDNTTIGGYIRIHMSELKLSAVNVLVGRHAVGKSVLMASLYDSLLQKEDGHHRYDGLTQPIECSNCTYAEYGIWLPAERVILPFSRVCEEREGAERELGQEQIALPRLTAELLYSSLKNLCRWQRNLAAMHEHQIFSPELHGMAYSYIMEAKEKAIRTIYDVSGDDEVKRYLNLTFPYVIIFEKGEDKPGEPPYRFIIRDMRSRRVISLREASHAASVAAILSTLSLAAAHAFIGRTVFAIEEPEEEAHPYAQFILGYVLSYTTLKTWLDPNSYGITLLVTTHSEYILSGMLRATYDLLVVSDTVKPANLDTIKPKVYIVDYADMPRDDEIEVEIREWMPGDVIPGFFGTALSLTISPRKLRELYGMSAGKTEKIEDRETT
ncbi:MAG TPA: hypothetical protein EYH50_04225 [Pyrodictium delaneyi]|uniref:Uncharacterized protein n=1 Tax=Pyrodictium delaneyi TaxID=1273541 RepID=A0A833E955_9CREN|nr:hypothetical protein [Pyrodictium delaneyi]